MAQLSLFDVSGKKALVTGAAAGLGRACAFALAMGGADVAIVDLNEELGNATVRALRDKGCNAFFVHANIAHAESVQAMMNTVVSRFGRLDIAVNNAGIYRAGLDAEHSIEDWHQVTSVNLTATWLCAMAEMQQMSRQKPMEGKIVNITSIAAHVAISNGSYDATKAGVVHMTRSLARQWGVTTSTSTA